MTIANTRYYRPTNITALIAANTLKDTDTVRISDTRPKEGIYIYIHGHITDAMTQGRDIQTMIEPYEMKRWQIDWKLHTWQDAQEGAVPGAARNIPEHTRKDALFTANEVRERRLYDVLLCLPLCYTALITLASEGVSVQTTSKLRPLLNLS